MSFCYSYVLTCVKKDRVVSCGKPIFTNWADKSYNIITLVTIIFLL